MLYMSCAVLSFNAVPTVFLELAKDFSEIIAHAPLQPDDSIISSTHDDGSISHCKSCMCLRLCVVLHKTHAGTVA